VVIEIEGFENTIWTIVGLILDLGAQAGQRSVYVNRDVLSADMNLVGRSQVAEIKGREESLAAQQAIEDDLLDYVEGQGIGVSYSTTALENKELANAQFNILTTVLLIMTVLIAAVGGFGLSGTSINVRSGHGRSGDAVGASSVSPIFVGEGLLLGLISWLIAIPLSAAAGRPFVAALGVILDFPFEYRYSSESILLWFAIIFVISTGASWLPSRRATQISVRESLAYDETNRRSKIKDGRIKSPVPGSYTLVRSFSVFDL
jgi:ABC-type lipoprotein release transport system permease subunit